MSHMTKWQKVEGQIWINLNRKVSKGERSGFFLVIDEQLQLTKVKACSSFLYIVYLSAVARLLLSLLNLSKKGATDCSAASAQSIHRWPVVPFSLCRHQRAPIHPADRDEDEQEWTTGTRQRQGDPGLTFDLSPLLNPLTFHPTSCTSHSPLSLPPLLTPPDGSPVRRDAITCLLQTNTYQALSATHPLPSSSPSSSPSFSLRCCGSSPSTQSARKL